MGQSRRLPLLSLAGVAMVPFLIVLLGVPACERGKTPAPTPTGEPPAVSSNVGALAAGPALPESEIQRLGLNRCAGESATAPTATVGQLQLPPTTTPPATSAPVPGPPEVCDCSYGATRAETCVPATPVVVTPCFKVGGGEACDARHSDADGYSCAPRAYKVEGEFCGFQDAAGNCPTTPIAHDVNCQACWVWSYFEQGKKLYDCRSANLAELPVENRLCVPGAPKTIKRDGHDGVDVKNWCAVHHGILEPVPDPSYPGREMCSGTCDRKRFDAWNDCLPVVEPPVSCDWCPAGNPTATGRVSVLAPAPSATVAGAVEVWGRVVASPAETAELLVDGTLTTKSTIQSGGYYFFRWNTAAVTNGVHSISVRVKHATLPMPAAAVQNVTVSNASPASTSSASASSSASGSSSASATSTTTSTPSATGTP